MTTDEYTKIILSKYLKQIDEFNWHHPIKVHEISGSQSERDQTNYYLSQLCHVLFNNYQQSHNEIGKMLNLSTKRVIRLVNAYSQNFTSLQYIMAELKNGENW
ncbi:hypothetical protein KII93_04210 [Leuconostoc gelidum subsp. gasicomitatum]|uniref:hypothetical protein n=1 Tax=Leuconostoc gasicomitatum TaxID=115778 RepID=UPI0007DF962D|nr:hypothetical protein [Leuconostoc gasicomitatum]MBZ5947676.1 hypothetical protein [Leuconostoc gasicomitatum]CUW14219.1 hypothetical protein PB1E_0585 [Leuconostoc gasicomitatum]